MTHADKVFILHCEVCRGDLHKACLNKFGLACDKFCKLSFWMNCLCFFHKTEALSLNAFDSGCQFEPVLYNVIGPIDARHRGHATLREFWALPELFQCDWQLSISMDREFWLTAWFARRSYVLKHVQTISTGI